MSSRLPMRTAWAALTLTTAPVLAHAGAGGVVDPQQTQVCNEPPPLVGQALGDIGAQIKGRDLKPGMTHLTQGTGVGGSPELNGQILLQTGPVSFSFDDGEGWVIGSYEELIVKGSDNACKTHLRLTVASRCISRVAFRNYRHPLDKKLVANYRRDLDKDHGGAPSHEAHRSDGLGRTITFKLEKKICGHATLPQDRQTRWLLLNTSAPQVGLKNSLVLLPPDGGTPSPMYEVHVPMGP